MGEAAIRLANIPMEQVEAVEATAKVWKTSNLPKDPNRTHRGPRLYGHRAP